MSLVEWLDYARSVPLPRLLVAVAVLGVPTLMVEMGYGHYRGNFHRPWMYIPVVLPPLFAAGGILVLLTSAAWALLLFAGLSLALLLMGGLGTFLHLQGVARRTGGLNLANVMVGPPALAPLSFGLLGVLGLLALAYWNGST